MNITLREYRKHTVVTVTGFILSSFTMFVILWQPELALNLEMPRVGSVTWMILRGAPLVGTLTSLFGAWYAYRSYRRLAVSYATDFAPDDYYSGQIPTNNSDQNTNRPPRSAEYLLYLLPKKTREPLLGDLEEDYHRLCSRFGKRHAELWYWWQVVASLGPLITACAHKVLKWGVLGWIGQIIRRFIS